MDNPFDENPYSVRPTFLTILCILTLIWNAYKFYGAIPNITTPEKVVAGKEQSNEMMMEMMSKYMGDKDLEKLEETQTEMDKLFQEKNLIASGVTGVISSALLILGAIWMWGLRKKGFYTYLAGNAVGVLAPIIIFGGQVGWAIGILSLIASAIFSGLYAMHLKYLR